MSLMNLIYQFIKYIFFHQNIQKLYSLLDACVQYALGV